MTPETADQLSRRLRSAGLSNTAIRAAWPTWWSKSAEASPSARLELRFTVARNLGLDPASLFDGAGTPRFVWRGEGRFKRLAVGSEVERDAITSFGKALSSIVVAAAAEPSASLEDAAANQLRRLILSTSDVPFVQLTDLLALCWGLAVPVVYLQLFPGDLKGMAAMTALIGDRPAVLLAQDSRFPGQLAFYLAHEIGHIALRHLSSDAVLVDMDGRPTPTDNDAEERAADEYALQLLTGESKPVIRSLTGHASGDELARVAIESARELQIEPGTIALCFAYSTGRWATAMRALRRIYPEAVPLWPEVNRLAISQLSLDRIPESSREYLFAALGLRT